MTKNRARLRPSKKISEKEVGPKYDVIENILAQHSHKHKRNTFEFCGRAQIYIDRDKHQANSPKQRCLALRYV